MYFKQIELAGFKSFADRLSIKFDGGITAIVGPNGCGKSNVADAIRWVLGEQSSKQLRGSSMQDVIFNGTKKRKSLSYCEATLTFNNTDRLFDYDYDELAITRKLYRSGESEYLINKNPCRLKDIINLFYDSGIGRDGYSIIGQGKVEEIISSKPETRRLIFEEAAGIAKFKSRKVEAERKLERTRENLTRLKDIIGELERQLGPLKKQAENAKKYLEFKSQLKDLEVNAYIFQYENASEIKQEINTKLAAITEELGLRESDYADINANYESNMSKINNIDKIISELHTKILDLTVGMEKQAGETKLLKERVNYLNEQNDKIQFDIVNSQQFIEKSEFQVSLQQDKLKSIDEEIEMLNKSSQELFSKFIFVNEQIELLEGESIERTRQVLDSIGKLTDLKSSSSKFQTEREMLITTKQELSEKIKDYTFQISKLKDNEVSAREFVQRANNQSDDYSKQQAKMQLNLASLNSQIKQQEQTRNNLYAKLQVYENRKRLLSEMQAEFEGYNHSVKKILKESEKNLEFKRKMVGVLANLIKVEPKFETAIEVALGNAVQNIVTYDEDNAKQLIAFLKQNNYGRATFLPITTMKPRRLNDYDLSSLKTKGCFGVASKLVYFDSKISNVIENLLGATVIVDTLDTAISLASNTRYSFKIVTLEGDVVNPQGSFTGGSKKNETANLISREREIETLAKEIVNIKEEFSKTEKEISNLVSESNGISKDLENIILLKGQAEIVSAKENEKLENLLLNLNSLVEEKLQSESKLNAINMKIEELENELVRAQELEKGTVIDKDDYDAKNKQKQEKLNALKAEREEYSNSLTAVKVKLASAQTEKQSIKDNLIRLHDEISSEQIILDSNKKQFEKNSYTINEANKLIEENVSKNVSAQTLEELENAKEKQKQLAIDKESMQDIIKQINEKRDVLIENINTLKEKKYAQEMQLAKVDTDIEAMQERIYEEYELTYESCLEFKRSDFDINLAMIDINKLKREISKLGYVNVNAIEDSKVVLERYEDMSSQAADLTKAEEDLILIIKDLSKEMETKFRTEFNKINENFKITFRELFGGGSAHLELLDEDNVLESGVEIVAEPPGKSLKSITLLSGGEKALTAIAILFAILKMRTLPFCLLDEIEAALDEANVERFAQYLRRFGKGTQFIVITHRKPTMELADSLYGVTMEEEGVSRMVSVKLSDALKNSSDEQAG